MISFGKTAVLGDSYSTFLGWIPEGQNCYYTGTGSGVFSVEETWWHRLISETASELVINDSYSGSTISYMQYGSFNIPQSFLSRAAHTMNGNVKLDTIFIFGATNDDWGDNILGSAIEKDVKDYSEEELRTVFPAVHCLLRYLAECNPSARLVVLINCDMKSPAIADELESAGKLHRADVIRLHDIDKVNGHPTAAGMEQIKNQILDHFA